MSDCVESCVKLRIMLEAKNIHHLFNGIVIFRATHMEKAVLLRAMQLLEGCLPPTFVILYAKFQFNM